MQLNHNTESNRKAKVDGAAKIPSRYSGDSRDFSGYGGIVGEVMIFIGDYIVLPELSLLVVASWLVASWLADHWDKFPYLAITSPGKRCGKTTLLDLLYFLATRPRYTTNISPAALYRVVEQERPTLLMDESQSISRRGSEASEVLREILNGGIGKNAKVTRCGGPNRDQIQEFQVYCPKAFAMIGDPDEVLADRSLPVRMKRRARNEPVKRYREKEIKQEAEKLQGKIKKWVKTNARKVAEIYQGIEPFDIDNDRMADVLMPLQAVLEVSDPAAIEKLSQYAWGLDERDKEREMQSLGIRLLLACREIYTVIKKADFIQTDNLIADLMSRDEEPWAHCNRGAEPITREMLANLLRPYGVKSQRNKSQTATGYFRAAFEDAWNRYLPVPCKNPAIPANPAIGPLGRLLKNRANGDGVLRVLR
jgi:hypothetical protein